MENSIEKDIHLLESYAGMTHKMNDNQGRPKLDQAIEHILSDYKRVLKENEELKAKWDKDTHILQNKLDYANADRIDLAQQNKELRKENEELNNRCRNLDTEAQAYLEELAGDNTLTKRTIKQLQKENEELNYKLHSKKIALEIYNRYIPKQKVKDKIEELKQERDETYTKFLGGNRTDENLSTRGKMIEGGIKVLQELLEESEE